MLFANYWVQLHMQNSLTNEQSVEVNEAFYRYYKICSFIPKQKVTVLTMKRLKSQKCFVSVEF